MTEIAETPTSGLRSFESSWSKQLSRPQRALVRKVFSDQIDPYLDFAMRKPSGGIRPISAPISEWMDVLKILQRDYLSAPGLVSSSAFAFVRGRSAAHCASVHLDSEWLIRVDIQDFFHSISEDRVYMTLKEAGLPSFPARILSRIATRRPAPPMPEWALPYMKNERILPGFGKRRTRRGFLPQGSPTSGSLSNMVAKKLDEDFEALATQYGWRYSRYADDLFISKATRSNPPRQSGEIFRLGLPPNGRLPNYGPREPSAASGATRGEVDMAVRRAHEIIIAHRFSPNFEKTRVMRRGNRQMVLGILVEGLEPRPSRDKVKYVAFHLHALEKYCDWSGHAKMHGFRDADSLAEFLSGYLSYFRDINPEWTSRFVARFDGIRGDKRLVNRVYGLVKREHIVDEEKTPTMWTEELLRKYRRVLDIAEVDPNLLQERAEAIEAAELQKVRQVGGPATSFTSGKPYSATNSMYLQAVAENNGWTDSRWITEDEINKRGGKVKDGQLPTKMTNWLPNYKKVIDDDGNEVRTFSSVSPDEHFVYNVQQVDGLTDGRNVPGN